MKRIFLLLVSVLLFINTPAQNGGFNISDKDKHMQAGIFINGLVSSSVKGLFKSNKWAVLGGLTAGIHAGDVKERYDRFKGGKYDLNDFFSTSWGSMYYSVTFIIYLQETKKRK